MSQDTYVPASLNSSGASFAQLQANGLNGLISLLIAANAAIANPASQATVNVTGGGSTGGLLPAGVYYVAYTYSDGWGETLLGTSLSASFTVAAGNIPQMTFHDTPPTNADFRNIYLTLAGGASGAVGLYATGIAVATTTFNLSFAGPQYASGSLEAAPSTNTTGALGSQSMIDRAMNENQAWVIWKKLQQLIDSLTSGQPVDWYYIRKEVQKLDNVFAAQRQLTADLCGLIVASPGSLHWKSTNVMPQQYRTFP